MALGTITRQTVAPGANTNNYMGGLRITVTQVVLDTSYPTGGSALSASQLGMTDVVLFAITSLVNVGANGPAEARYNIPNGTLQAFSATGEIANATNLSAATAEIVAFGY
jgi:hypothetical protein